MSTRTALEDFPPLPEPLLFHRKGGGLIFPSAAPDGDEPLFTAADMHAYLLADRAARATPGDEADLTAAYMAGVERGKEIAKATQPEAPAELMRSALERITANFRLLLAGSPVRDVSETLAECDAALGGLLPVAQPVEPKAKPLEWDQHSPAEWIDKRCGFYIAFDPVDEPETPYGASWGESDSESFVTLEGAKAWCQRQIDGWVAEIADTHPLPVAQAPEGWKLVPMGADAGHVRSDAFNRRLERRIQERAESRRLVCRLCRLSLTSSG